MTHYIDQDNLQHALADVKLSRLQKILLILFYDNESPKSASKIQEIGSANGLRECRTWNISDILGRSKGMAANPSGGWIITAVGRAELIGKNLVFAKTQKKQETSIQTNIEHCDYAIIAALYDDEYTSFKDFLEDEKIVDGFETMVIAKLKGSDKKVVIDFQTRMGMVEATYLSTQILARFSPKYLVMVGVCGGRASKGVKLLDIIIPNKVFDYQSGKYDKGEFKPYLRVCNINNKKAIASQKSILRAMEDHVATPLKAKCKTLVVHGKTMACGNVVVKTDGYLDKTISAFDEETVGVEMESFGVVRTTELVEDKKVTPIIIKSVMDYTEKGKNDQDKATAAYFSACFTYFLIRDHL
ncbi:MAG: 5'-methylthioadenosine/S-adenosylhomocysteine nucleosidase family protein [Bacteroidia bacterium]